MITKTRDPFSFIPVVNKISTTIIQSQGLVILQGVAEWAPGQFKVFWIRDNIDIMEIDGKPNFIFHKDFEDIENGLPSAIGEVKDLFCEYWEINNKF